jgi:hypothetical protein
MLSINEREDRLLTRNRFTVFSAPFSINCLTILTPSSKNNEWFSDSSKLDLKVSKRI